MSNASTTDTLPADYFGTQGPMEEPTETAPIQPGQIVTVVAIDKNGFNGRGKYQPCSEDVGKRFIVYAVEHCDGTDLADDGEDPTPYAYTVLRCMNTGANPGYRGRERRVEFIEHEVTRSY